MPRVRLTAGSWLLAAAIIAVVQVPRAHAAPPVAGRQAGPGAAAAGARAGDTEARRREEIDALQRQDIADALKKHFNIDVDWRTTPLAKLIDIRVRAAKAADLQARLGVSVEWQRYSWIELEALRRTLLSFEQYRNGEAPTDATPVTAQTSRPSPPPEASTNALVRPTFKVQAAGRAGRSTDPDAIIRPKFTGRTEVSSQTRDPDGVIRPTFAVRPRWPSAGGDPDGLITPTFLPVRRFAPIGDADDLMDPTRTQDGRSTSGRW